MRQPMIIHDDGIALAADLETPEGCCGACPLVILLHGFSSARNRIHTLQAAAAMREDGFATLRADLYGHGESGGEFSKHTLYKWISNTLAVIDHVRGMGYTDLYLSGHSQGGLVAALTAGMEPDRIRGLVLRAPAFMIPRCAREGNLLGFRFDPDHVPDSVPALNGLALDGNYIRVAQAVRAEETAARFKGPVLILHGDEDDVVPLEDSQRMAALYADCELAVMPGETHHYDRHPEEMQDLIRAFCRKIKP
ncbi:MAG: alpha/beta fold hydrolase [Clostridia bacterium]|nr:alpha/beta fold hydrolase [Clostridia bacterium]